MKKLYNLKQLEDLSSGSKEFISEIVSVFIQEIPSQIDSIKEALEENNIESLSKIVHKIKPSIELLGIISITEHIRVLEKSTDIKNNRVELNRLFSKIKIDIDNTIKELKIEFNI